MLLGAEQKVGYQVNKDKLHAKVVAEMLAGMEHNLTSALPYYLGIYTRPVTDFDKIYAGRKQEWLAALRVRNPSIHQWGVTVYSSENSMHVHIYRMKLTVVQVLDFLERGDDHSFQLDGVLNRTLEYSFCDPVQRAALLHDLHTINFYIRQQFPPIDDMSLLDGSNMNAGGPPHVNTLVAAPEY